MYGLTTWEKNNCNTYIDQYFKKKRQSDNELGQLIEYSMRNIFFERSYVGCVRCVTETIPRLFLKNQN